MNPLPNKSKATKPETVPQLHVSTQEPGSLIRTVGHECVPAAWRNRLDSGSWEGTFCR